MSILVSEVMAPLIMDLLIMEVCLRGRVQHHHALKPGGMFGLYVQRKAPITHTHSEICQSTSFDPSPFPSIANIAQGGRFDSGLSSNTGWV